MKKSVFILGLLLSLLSCKNDLLYEEYIKIPGETWNNRNILHFSAGISDTTGVYDIFIIVRNINRYEFSNLFIFVTAQSPDNKIVRDTVEIQIADDEGNWLGKGAASIFTVTRPYRLNIKFPIPGIYIFDIEQAMRVDNLKYVTDVGISIEKSK